MHKELFFFFQYALIYSFVCVHWSAVLLDQDYTTRFNQCSELLNWHQQENRIIWLQPLFCFFVFSRKTVKHRQALCVWKHQVS